MLTLIKREIEANMIFFIITAIPVTIIAGVIVYELTTEVSNEPSLSIPFIMYKVFGTFPLFCLPLISTIVGVVQMNTDKKKKTSSFLSTLATTRRQILTAKIITGLLWILVVLLPLAVVDAILLHIFPHLVLVELGFFVNIFITVFFCSLACYAFGLQIGWNSKKILTTLGMILVPLVLMSVIIIKGFGQETIIIYLLFTVAAMVRVCQKFMSTPL